jgi:Alcohol dehydrogenase GroES-like domain
VQRNIGPRYALSPVPSTPAPVTGWDVSMHAIEVAQTAGPEVLRYVEKPRPSPGAGEVLIKAEAIGVNFVDTYFRSGHYPHQLPFVLGGEVAGVVEAVGDGVTALQAGDRVASAEAVGAYAEYCIAPVDLVAALPDAAFRPWRCGARSRCSARQAARYHRWTPRGSMPPARCI